MRDGRSVDWLIEKEVAVRSYLTQTEVAEIFGVSTRTVRNWISKGLITGYKRNNFAVLVDERSLDNVLVLIKGRK